MSDVEQPGAQRAAVTLIVVTVAVLVVVLAFVIVDKVRNGQASPLPQLQAKGLQWADARAAQAGFRKPDAHDALGRDRTLRDEQAWQVCFQVPPTGVYAKSTRVQLGVVRLNEKCPSTDQWEIDKAGALMPDLFNRTAFIARKSLGDDASIQFVDVVSQREVTRDLGNYRICTQEPAAGAPWDGVPVKAAVVPYSQDCAHPRGAAATKGITQVLDDVLDRLSSST